MRSGYAAAPRRRRRHTGWAQRVASTTAGASPSGSLPRCRQAGAMRVTAISTPERLTVSDRSPSPPSPEVDVRVVGFGSRGANAMNKLMQHGKVGGALFAGGMALDKALQWAVHAGCLASWLPQRD